MNKKYPPFRNPIVSRRGFLRGLTGGALALSAGGVLTACGGGDDFKPRNVPLARNGGDLFVSTFTGNTIERYDATTGAYKATIPTGFGPAGLAEGPDGDLFVAMRFAQSVERYDPGTGTLKGRLNGLSAPHSCCVGTDGVLYVPNAVSYFGYPGDQDTIEKYDARTGTHLGTFAHMVEPFSLVWGPDNNLYASTALELGNQHPNSDSIRYFDGRTGALLGLVVQNDKVPFDMVFTPNGTVLVTEFITNRVQEYDLKTGASIRTFCVVSSPIGITYGPNGDIYVGSYSDEVSGTNTGSVFQYDAQTGKIKGTLVKGLVHAAFLKFI